MRAIVLSLLVVAASGLLGCATYSEDLNRGQRHLKANEYERALATLRLLEHDLDSLSPRDRARYGYLRGIADYRLGFRKDARYWLGFASAINQQTPGGLQAEWEQFMKDALVDLNREVFGEETADEAATPRPGFAPTGL